MFTKKIRRKYRWQIVTLLLFLVLIVTFNLFFNVDVSPRWQELNVVTVSVGESIDWEEQFFPVDGTELPVSWGDLGQQLIEKGVIDKDQFENLYAQRGGLDDYEKNLIYETVDDKITITRENASFLLNLFWALGLSNKNPILEEGPMQDEQYGGADGFASTGGWSLAKGDVMDHYSKYDFIVLTEEQQALVEKVSQNVYRPCCNNSTS